MDEIFRQLFDHESKNEACLSPGYRFRPTEEELIIYYLRPKVFDGSFTPKAIGEVDVYKCEPWELLERVKIKEDTEWYFFTQTNRKYPTSHCVKINRSTTAGYWKTCGTDCKINSITSGLIGMKKTLVFYKGRAPKGEKTNWIMYEFRLPENFSQSSKDEWVISRILNKSGVGTVVDGGGVGKGTSCLSSEVSGSLPPLLNSSLYGFATSAEHESFYNDNISNAASKAYEINCFSTTTTSFVPHDQIVPPEPLTSSSFNPMSAFQATLQDNLELPFFYSSVAPPMHGDGGETSNSKCSSGEINLLPPSDNDMLPFFYSSVAQPMHWDGGETSNSMFLPAR